MIFTRYLYNADEVCYTFLECLIKNENLDECYFWIYEYFSSGFKEETWQFLWQVYYDFYALNYPRTKNNIIRNYKIFKKDEDFIHIMHVVKNLFRFVNKDDKKIIDYKIFMNRVYYSQKLVYLFKDKNYEDIEKYKCKTNYEKLLVKSIICNCDKSIAYYLKKNIDNDRLGLLLKKVCKNEIKSNKYYKNKYHVLLFEILNNNNNGKYYYKRENNEMKNLICESDIPMSPIKLKSMFDISQIYKTLNFHRKYSISSHIGCFPLERFNYNLNEMFWYHWEYFAYNAPLWKKRFDKFKIKINDEKKCIDFLDDDELDEFYDQYNYEPDEQSLETQQKSTLLIKKKSYKKWINILFN